MVQVTGRQYQEKPHQSSSAMLHGANEHGSLHVAFEWWPHTVLVKILTLSSLTIKV